jgi:hypothetical protein
MSFYSRERFLKHTLQGVILNTIKGLGSSQCTLTNFQMRWSNVWSNKWYQNQGYGFELRSVTLREELLECNSVALFTWITLKTYFVECDPECHKKLRLFSLDSNSFSNENVKGSIEHITCLCFCLYDPISLGCMRTCNHMIHMYPIEI